MSFKLMPIITLPTRITSNIQICIDHIFVRCDANAYITPCVFFNELIVISHNCYITES